MSSCMSSMILVGAVLLLALAGLVWYFTGKLREQDHKIESMMSLVSTMAEEIHVVKQFGGHLPQPSSASSHQNPSSLLAYQEEDEYHQQQQKEVRPEGPGIIEVSDGEEEEEGEDSEEEDSEEEDENCYMDDDDDISTTEEISDIGEEEEMEELNELPEEGEQRLSATDMFLRGALGQEMGEVNVSVVYMDSTGMIPANLFSNLNLNLNGMMLMEQPPEQDQEDKRVVELMSDNEESKAPMSEGPKKPSVNELRQQVQERGLATAAEAAKMKKPELMKLLQSKQ